MPTDVFVPQVVFTFGPVEITTTVLYSLVVSGLLVAFALLARASLAGRSSGWGIVAELVVEHLEEVMSDMLGRSPRPYTPLVVTLALFIGVANLIGLVPGLSSPTGDISTTAALAIIVFFAVPFYGIRARGLRGYLRRYIEPTPILLPLEIISEFSRTLALAVRLFGNVMSGGMIISVLLLLAGLLVPVPIMMLSVITGLVQAYIFAVLTVVYMSAAIRTHEN